MEDSNDSTGHQEPPIVEGLASFTSVRESFGDDGSGNITFKCTKFELVDTNTHAAWSGTLDIPQKHVTVKQAIDCLRRVPDNEIYPTATPDLPLIAAMDYHPAEDTWLKRPNIAIYSQVAGSTMIADDFVEEIRIYQLLQTNPHPNLVTFKGCLQKNGRVIGVLLERYAMTLSTRWEGYNQAALDQAACFKGIEAGIKHLHSMGLAHNDLNPRNIMLDEQDRPVVIDMGSCKKLGAELHQMGTPDWNDGFQETSSIINDEIGLGKIRKWLMADKERQS